MNVPAEKNTDPILDSLRLIDTGSGPKFRRGLSPHSSSPICIGSPEFFSNEVRWQVLPRIPPSICHVSVFPWLPGSLAHGISYTTAMLPGTAAMPDRAVPSAVPSLV